VTTIDKNQTWEEFLEAEVEDHDTPHWYLERGELVERCWRAESAAVHDKARAELWHEAARRANGPGEWRERYKDMEQCFMAESYEVERLQARVDRLELLYKGALAKCERLRVGLLEERMKNAEYK
jgi:hypothetical protein